MGSCWEVSPVLCDYLQGCDGVGGGTEVQEEGDVCILTAGPHC